MKGRRKRLFMSAISMALALAYLTAAAGGQTARRAQTRPTDSLWDVQSLARPPKTYPAPKVKSRHPGVRGLFYDGPPYRGRPTRVFAWYGAPKAASPKTRVPGVVLVHGGGGTAFDQWVAIWNRRGYAAIAMDLEGHLPGGGRKKTGHKWSGPSRAGIFADIGKPVKDQWMYHAVTAVVKAHSLLRSFGEVDAGRTGLAGISWGGIVACNVVGVDERFRFAIPVYGCGFLFDADNQYTAAYKKMSQANAARCKSLWDGSSHLPQAKMPMLWVNGTNDGHFPMNIFRKSYRAAAGPRTLCIRIRMGHGHQPGWAPKEIYAFADSIVKGGPPLIRVTEHGRKGNAAWVRFDPKTPAEKAGLCFTTDTGKWPARKWRTRPASIDRKASKATATIPEGATAWFFNLTDRRGLTVSSEHEQRAPAAK